MALPAAATILIFWQIYRDQGPEKVGEAIALKRLRKIEIIAPAIGVGFTLWALALARHPTPAVPGHLTAQGQMVLFTTITLVPVALLLTPVPRAAVRLLVATMPFYALTLLSRGTTSEVLSALYLVVVSAVMVLATLAAARDFEHHIVSRKRVRRMIAETSRQARTDPVTGVANRREFFERLTEAAHAGRPHCVGLLDLDGFKRINDVYGHPAGDQALVAIAERLDNFAGSHGFRFCRVGGDEFAFIAFDLGVTRFAALLADEALRECRSSIALPGAGVRLDASIGVGVFRADEGVRSAYMQASYALSQAKISGRGRVIPFDSCQRSRMEDEYLLEQALRSADLAVEISVNFQPIYLNGGSRLSGFEALARWHLPEKGMVSPALFIPCAERIGLIEEITRAVAAKALAAAAHWPDTVHLTLNLSMRDLSNPIQLVWLQDCIKRSGVDPGRIAFEITESMVIEDFELVQSAVATLRAMGSRIAVDDFGTGYSNLRNVHRLKPNIIKIDKSFVDALGHDDGAEAIVQTILELSRAIGARTVAEGVETARQLVVLADLGCDAFQGYYFSQPLPQDAATDLAQGGPEPDRVPQRRRA